MISKTEGCITSRHFSHNRHNPKNDGSDGNDAIAAPCSASHSMRNGPLHAGGTVPTVNPSPGRSLTIEWLNSLEAAQFLRLSVKALRNKTSNGQVPFHKFGRLNRYRRDELEVLLLSKKRGKYGNQT